MSYIVILMSFTAIFPSIGYGLIKHIYKHGKHTAATKLKLSLFILDSFICCRLHVLTEVLWFIVTIRDET
jgi:uncharacterized membrane protein